jgi:UDP-N-acetylmuramoyl-tripeptide--D-alanyl-D-alanine ligase
VDPRKKLLRRWHGWLLNCRAAIRRLTLRHTTFIAVTGSCGKTTAIALSDAILSSVGKCCTGMGARRWLVAETIIGASASTRFCIQELHASFPGLVGESLRLLRPQIGVVTTIGGDHHTHYRSLGATAREKGQLVENLPRSGVAILNADSPHIVDMAQRTRARLVTFGLSPQADVRALEVTSVWPNRLSMMVRHGHETTHVETRLVGEHWATSVLAAIACGIACGVNLQTCASIVKTVEPVFGRYSVHTGADGRTFVLDTYKASLWTIAHGLAFVGRAIAPHKTVVFGTVSDFPGIAAPVHRQIARDALKVADRVIFVGPQYGHSAKLRPASTPDGLFAFQTSYQASEFLASHARVGELIYVKGLITDHLERIALSQVDEIACWRERCGKWRPCILCGKYRNATPPPTDIVDWNSPPEQV